MTDHMLNVNYNVLGLLLADKDGALFFIDEGRGQNKNGALRRAQEGWVETLVQNSSGPFQSPTCLAFNPKQDTLYISNMSYGSDIKTSFNILYVTREGGFMDVKGLCKFRKSRNARFNVIHRLVKFSFVINLVDIFIALMVPIMRIMNHYSK